MFEDGGAFGREESELFALSLYSHYVFLLYSSSLANMFEAFQSLILTLARQWRLHVLGCAWAAYYGNQLSPLTLSLSLSLWREWLVSVEDREALGHW